MPGWKNAHLILAAFRAGHDTRAIGLSKTSYKFVSTTAFSGCEYHRFVPSKERKGVRL